MGDGDLQFPHLILGKKAQIFRFAADAQDWFFFQLQSINNDDHPPDTAVPIGGDSAGIIVNCQFLKSVLVDTQSQFLIGFPYDGFPSRFIFLATAANETPDIGIPALFKEQPSLAGDDRICAQMGPLGGFGGIFRIATVKGYDRRPQITLS